MISALSHMETQMLALYTKFIRDNAGVTAIEYGLIAVLVAVACIVAWDFLGTSLQAEFNFVASSV